MTATAAGHDGKRSEIGSDRLLKGDERRRKQYWDGLAASYRTKLPQWEHEAEHRIVFYPNLIDLDDKACRKVTYKFDDLDGIIFGLKTPVENKVAAVPIIERKCTESNWDDFEFWQACRSYNEQKSNLYGSS